MLLQHGDSGPEVVEIRYLLAALELLGLPTGQIAEEEDFDGEVDHAVRTFQQRRGLISDGIVGSATYRALCNTRWDLGKRTLSYTLSAPMSGDDVVDLQRRLSGLGYHTGSIDGIFGATTDVALRDFQQDCLLPADGVCGPETVAELSRIRRPMTHGARPQYLREAQAVQSAGPALSGKRMAIDPGHGPGDRWGTVAGVSRDTIAWNIARLLDSRMTATGIDTFLTRSRRENPSGSERATRANEVTADLLIGIQVDAWKSTDANGLSTFHFGTDSGHASTVGAELADLVHRELVARTSFTDCRVHHATWDLLRGTKMPAVLISLGYVTHDGDRALLTDEVFQSRIAEGILVAIKRLYLAGRDEFSTGTYTLADLAKYESGMTR